MIKKSLCAIAIVGCFGVATIFSANTAEAQKGSIEVGCYTSVSTVIGAWYISCHTCERAEDALPQGSVGKCQKRQQNS